MSAKETAIAHNLSVEGQAFSEELRDDNRWYFENLPDSYFAIAAAISLTWTKHAAYKDEFITYASGYIDGKLERDPLIASRFCLRFGREELDNALLNYRRYYNQVRDLMIDFNKCDVNQLNRLQQKLLNKLSNLRNEGIISGIGPWLFTGPFKIILSDQDRLWDQDGIDAIVLPTGLEVDRGINRLIKEGYSFMRDFDRTWLEENYSLLDSYGTYSMVHTFISNIGHIASTPALHINSALYLYGRNDI